MCGIVGVLGQGREDERRDVVDRMSAALRHRGPDDSGAWCGADACLGMRRLAIIDLAGGTQPMWTDEGVGIVFNGEIYNHAEIRSRLGAAGERFRTASDTEVLLRLIAREGVAGLHAVEGMFAACIVDTAARTALLLRDRMGKKPLYYGRHGDQLLFASELKAIVEVLPRRPEIDLQAVHDYLSLRYVPGPNTIWAGFDKLAPGHALAVDLATGRQELSRWWDVEIVADEPEAGRDYVAELDGLLTRAVERRIVASDVPVGVLLSGGLDSSAVSAAAVRSGHRAFHTFAVGYEEGSRHSELPHARSVAEHLGSRHHELRISADDFAEGLPELVWQTDEPLADLTAIPLHRLARVAAEEVKVVLSGEGADELLAGYSFDRMAASLERYRPLDRVPGGVLRAAGRVVPGAPGEVLAALGRAGWSRYPDARGAYISWTLGEADKRALWRSQPPPRPTEALLAQWYDACRSEHPLDRAQQVALRSWLPEDLLMKADKSTMAASLELRCPFLDRDVVEWAARLPVVWKVGDRASGWTTKRVLRELGRRWLPASVVDRPKQGFSVPAYDWLRGDGGAWAQRALARPGGAFPELFDQSALAPAVSAARGGDASAAQRVWLALVLRAWLDRWTA